MKCRNCDNEAIYEDGLCEQCHQQAQQQGQQQARVMTDYERDAFTGQTINEDGTLHEEPQEEEQSLKGIHIYASNFNWRVKLALGFIVFCIVAIIIGVLGMIVVAMPYLLGALVLYFAYTIVKGILKGR